MTGHWRQDVMWGFGIKEFQEHEDEDEITVYEGWFVNGDFHGIGCFNYSEGSYLYGNFRNGDPIRKVLNYYANEDYWYVIEDETSSKIKEDYGDPPSYLNGSKIKIERCYIETGRDFNDNQFNYGAIQPNLDVSFYRLGKLWPKANLFNQAISYDMFEPGQRTNIEFATCLEALAKCPYMMQQIFSENYSSKYGFYNVCFFERGYWKQIIVDDKIPVDIGKYGCPLFINKVNNNLAPLILEKAYAKYSRCWYNFNQLYPEKYDIRKEKNLMLYTLTENILYMLTGFVCTKIPIGQDNENDSFDKEVFKRQLHKYFDFKIRLAFPNLKTCEKLKFKTPSPYVLQDIWKSDREPVFVFKSLKGSKGVIKTDWENDKTNLTFTFLKEYGDRIKDFRDGMFLCGIDEIHNYFDNIVISMARPYQIVQTVSRKYNLHNASGNKNLYYSMQIPFQSAVVIQVEQYFSSKVENSNIFKQEPFPIRIVIAKNIDDKFQYITGIGQKIQQRIAKSVVLDQGFYLILIQLQVTAIPEIELVLTTQSSNNVTIEKYRDTPPPQFLSRVYIDCATKYGKEVDLTQIKNYVPGLKLIQLFKPTDGVYLQYFKNESQSILWNHKVNFQYINMKIHGSRKKNVKIDTQSRNNDSKSDDKNDNTNVQIMLRPGREHLILIMQVNGQDYNLEGGSGTCEFLRKKQKFLEGDPHQYEEDLMQNTGQEEEQEDEENSESNSGMDSQSEEADEESQEEDDDDDEEEEK